MIKLRDEIISWPINKRDDLDIEQNRILEAAMPGMSLDDNRLFAANIVDCRLYRIRDNAIKQLTKDQTLVIEERRPGKISAEEDRKHPKRHILSNAIGHITENSKIYIIKKSIIEKDIFLICTDRPYSMIDDDHILDIFRNNID